MLPTRTTESAITAAAMLGLFLILLVPGFWLRHGYPIWEALL